MLLPRNYFFFVVVFVFIGAMTKTVKTIAHLDLAARFLQPYQKPNFALCE